jgi:hypothetical protein
VSEGGRVQRINIDAEAVMVGVRLKIARGSAVLESLLNHVSKALEESTIGNLRPNDDGTWSAFFALHEPPSPGWGLLLGDVAHNLRSALDNLITVLVVRNGHQPRRSNGFPVYIDESQWLNKVASRYPTDGPLANVSQQDYDRIAALQPFVGRNTEEAGLTPLGALTRISNADKHGAIHASMTYQPDVKQSLVEVQPPVPVEIIWTPPPFTPIEDGAEMTRIRFLDEMPPGVMVGINWPLAVMFVDYKGRKIRTGELLDIPGEVIRVVGTWDDQMRKLAATID